MGRPQARPEIGHKSISPAGERVGQGDNALHRRDAGDLDLVGHFELGI